MPSLFIDVEGRFAKFSDSLDALSRNASKSVGQVDRAFGALKTTLATVGVTVSVGAFTAMVKGAIDAADHLNDLSKKTGIAVETLGGLGFAAQQAGGNLDSFADSATKLNRSIAEAGAGNKEKIDAFQKLGISVTDATGKLRSADDVMLDLADRFESYEDGPRKVAIAIALLGKAGADAIPVLNEGGQKLKENIEYYKRFSGVTTEVAAKADEFNDAMTKIKLLSGALGTTIAVALLPHLQDLADSFLKAKEEGESFGGMLGWLKTPLQALAVLAVQTNFAFSTLGKDMARAWENVKLIAKGDFEGSRNLGKLFAEDAAKARKETDALIDSIMTGRRLLGKPLSQEEVQDIESGRGITAIRKRKGQAPALADSGAASRAEALEKAKSDLIQARAKITVDAEQNAAKARLAVLDHFYKEGFANEEHYWNVRAQVQQSAYEIERKALDASIANRQKAVDAFKTPVQQNTKEYFEATKALIEEQAKRNKLDADFNAQGNTDVLARAKATQEYERAIKNVNIQLEQLQGNTAKAAGESFDQQNERLLREADARGDVEGRARIEALRNATVAQARFNEVREKANDVTARLALEEERIQNSLRVGAIGEFEALRRTEQARLNALNTLRLTRTELDSIAEGSGMEKLRLDAEKFGVQMETLATQTNLVADRFNKAFEDSVSSAFADFITGAKTAKEAFKSFANSVIKNLADIYAKEVATGLFGNAGGGGIGGILAKLLMGGRGSDPTFDTSQIQIDAYDVGHTGGIVGALTASRIAPVSSNAPRFHGGGVVGGERRIIAKVGEGIFTPEQMAALQPASDPVVIQNTYNIDSRSDRGEIVQLIERNRRQTISDVADLTRRGGSYKRAMRG